MDPMPEIQNAGVDRAQWVNGRVVDVAVCVCRTVFFSRAI